MPETASSTCLLDRPAVTRSKLKPGSTRNTRLPLGRRQWKRFAGAALGRLIEAGTKILQRIVGLARPAADRGHGKAKEQQQRDEPDGNAPVHPREPERQVIEDAAGTVCERRRLAGPGLDQSDKSRAPTSLAHP